MRLLEDSEWNLEKFAELKEGHKFDMMSILKMNQFKTIFKKTVFIIRIFYNVSKPCN